MLQCHSLGEYDEVCNTSLVLISSYKHICPSLNIRHISCYPKCQLNEDRFINESLLKANIFSASFNTSSFSIQYLNGISNTLHLQIHLIVKSQFYQIDECKFWPQTRINLCRSWTKMIKVGSASYNIFKYSFRGNTVGLADQIFGGCIVSHHLSDSPIILVSIIQSDSQIKPWLEKLL